MEYPKAKDLTPEQRKEILKVLSKARWTLLGFGFKSFLGMFVATFVTTAISIVVFKDSDLEMMKGFQFCCTLVNTFFMIRYLRGQLETNSGIISSKIDEILKKSEQKDNNESTSLE